MAAAKKQAPKKKAVPTTAVLAKRLDKVVENTDKALADIQDQITTGQQAMMEAINKLPTRAIDNPVTPKKYLESQEQDLGNPIDLDEDTIIDKVKVTDINNPNFKDKINMEAFMAEPVAVQIHQVNDVELPSVFDISVNGRSEIFHYGQTKVVKRCYVEGLARAKPVHYRNEEYTNDEGVKGVRYPAKSGLRYPFAVAEDRNPMGATWLKTVLLQP